MSIELRQQMKLAQKLLMTQQLQQAIKLLQLNRMELAGALQAEIEQNPLLEEAPQEEDSSLPAGELHAEEGEDSGETPGTVRVTGDDPAAAAEINWEDYTNNFDADFSFARETPAADAPSRLDFVSAAPNLLSFLSWQLAHLELNERDQDIARFILGNLDGHGFLDADIAEICAGAGCTEEEAEAMLRLVQSLDPPGVAARSVQESLLLQLERKDLEDSLAGRMASEFLNELQNRNFADIARRTGAAVREIQQAADLIAELAPYPGNAYSSEPVQYITPDLYIVQTDDEFVVQPNSEGLPRLQLAADYHKQLAGKLTAESKDYLQDRKRSALLLLHALDYRQSTICRVMESIARHQHDFFAKGPGFLKPLVLSDIARDVGVHESTVSRATANKYVHTPHGIYELKHFFSTAAAAAENGDELTAETVKQHITQLVRQENRAKPLSDGALAELLDKDGIKVARRTVAKYREQLRIPPVKLRRRQ